MFCNLLCNAEYMKTITVHLLYALCKAEMRTDHLQGVLVCLVKCVK